MSRGAAREVAPLGGYSLDPAFVGPPARCACGYDRLACESVGGHEARVRERAQTRLHVEDEVCGDA